MSVSQPNSSRMVLTPASLVELRRRSPGTTPAASSSGRVMRLSTSLGAESAYSVCRVRVG